MHTTLLNVLAFLFLNSNNPLKADTSIFSYFWKKKKERETKPEKLSCTRFITFQSLDSGFCLTVSTSLLLSLQPDASPEYTVDPTSAFTQHGLLLYLECPSYHHSVDLTAPLQPSTLPATSAKNNYFLHIVFCPRI